MYNRVSFTILLEACSTATELHYADCRRTRTLPSLPRFFLPCLHCP